VNKSVLYFLNLSRRKGDEKNSRLYLWMNTRWTSSMMCQENKMAAYAGKHADCVAANIVLEAQGSKASRIQAELL
jgi:hypothetical protein